jgi:hypothetical protein
MATLEAAALSATPGAIKTQAAAAKAPADAIYQHSSSSRLAKSASRERERKRERERERDQFLKRRSVNHPVPARKKERKYLCIHLDDFFATLWFIISFK